MADGMMQARRAFERDIGSAATAGAASQDRGPKMTTYIIRRLLIMPFILFGVTVLIFAMLRSGWNLRLRDPSMSSPMMLASTAVMLYVIDAADMAAPPVARIRIPQRVPTGYHTRWVPEAALARQRPL